MYVSVKESTGAVVINEIHSQAIASHICCRFRGAGSPATIEMLPGVAGYRVSVPDLGLLEVERVLKELRIESQRR